MTLETKRIETAISTTGHWFPAADCAARVGLTPRALRLYERCGLIKPRRTEKNWRLYGPAEIVRLNEIMALKRLGLSLSRITALLAGKSLALDHVLAMQEQSLLQSKKRAELGLSLVLAARQEMAAGKQLSTPDLITLIKETEMTDSPNDDMAWHLYEQTRPRVEQPIDSGLLPHYVGTYRFDSNDILTVTQREGGITIQMSRQPQLDAFSEGPDKFFLKIVPAQISFERNGAGQAESLVLHQGGHEQVAVRIDPAAAKALEDTRDQRFRTQTPLPGSEAILRRLISEHQSGRIDFSKMTPLLAGVVTEQLPLIQQEMKEQGTLTALRFKGVGEDDCDVYEVAFEKMPTEWRFCLDGTGKISGLSMRRLP
jgi:DNA-binding transcriptional MerR regulator